MTKRPMDTNGTSHRLEATTTVAPARAETFHVEDGYLIRRVLPRRGEPPEHRCRLGAYREAAWAAIDLAADGFTVETLADQVRSRPREEHDDREPWASYTNAAVAIPFCKQRPLLAPPRLPPRDLPPALHDDIAVERVEFHQECATPRLLRRDQRTARSAKQIQH